jgi:hypothetical protein
VVAVKDGWSRASFAQETILFHLGNGKIGEHYAHPRELILVERTGSTVLEEMSSGSGERRSCGLRHRSKAPLVRETPEELSECNYIQSAGHWMGVDGPGWCVAQVLDDDLSPSSLWGRNEETGEKTSHVIYQHYSRDQAEAYLRLRGSTDAC